MSWYRGFEEILTREAALACRTTFGIGGVAEALLEPRDAEEFAAAWAAACASGLPVRLLGGGSNLLVPDEGVRGVVVATTRLNTPAAQEGERVIVAAGLELRRLLRFAMARGLSGLEGLVGIPGTVGGAVRMNAGGRHGSIGRRVERVWCATREGRIVERAGAEVAWGYRETDLRDPVLRVELKLVGETAEGVRERTRGILRDKARAQPLAAHSAGCFFRNPPQREAWRLIDEAGLKGFHVGDAAVSRKHANFVINLGRATAADVLSLSGAVRERVRDRSGIVLENEVHCWAEARN
jgi:UDP-N-acetylmuramate dehydrogenase